MSDHGSSGGGGGGGGTKHASSGQSSPFSQHTIGFLFVLAALAMGVGSIFRSCSSKEQGEDTPGATSPSRQGNGSGQKGQVPQGTVDGLVEYVTEPKSLLRDVSADALFKEHYIFLNMLGQVDAETRTPLKEIIIPLSRKGINVRLVGRKWSITPDIWELRMAATGRWRDSREDSDWVTSSGHPITLFPEFELRLAEDIEFDPENPPMVTITVD